MDTAMQETQPPATDDPNAETKAEEEGGAPRRSSRAAKVSAANKIQAHHKLEKVTQKKFNQHFVKVSEEKELQIKEDTEFIIAV